MKKLFATMIFKRLNWAPSLKASRSLFFANYSTATGAAAPQRKILSVHEIPSHIQTEMTNALLGCYTSKMFANLLKENLNQITDYQLSYALFRMADLNLELDENFYNTLVPIIKEFVRVMNRENNKPLGEIIGYCGRLNVKDEALWTLYEQKLVQEKLYRYLPLKLFVEMMHGMALAGRGSPELFEIFEKELIKHRLALDNLHSEIARDAFEKRNLGSPIIYKVLEAPRADYAELKVKEVKGISQKH